MHDFLQWLKEGALDTATYETWYAVGAFVLSTLGAWLARAKGAPRHVIWAFGGAAASVATLLVIWLILIWSGQKTVLILLAALAACGLVYVVRYTHAREMARLAGHRKGLSDYKRDFKIATARNTRSTARLTREMVRIGTRTASITKGLPKAKTEAAQDAIWNRSAAMYRRAAIRYRRRAEAVRDSLKDFTDATDGIIGWLEEAGKTDEAKQHVPVLMGFRRAIVSARDATETFRTSLIGIPNVSQRLNASRAELVQSVDILIETLGRAISWTDGVLQRLGGTG
jgi:hypothetical protein